MRVVVDLGAERVGGSRDGLAVCSVLFFLLSEISGLGCFVALSVRVENDFDFVQFILLSDNCLLQDTLVLGNLVNLVG